MCYVRTELAPLRLSSLETNNNDNGRIESLAIEIHIKQQKWLLYCIYKQPQVKDKDFVTTLNDIRKIAKSCKTLRNFR